MANSKPYTPADRLLTRREVERMIGVSRSTLYEMMSADRFPRPLKISSQAVRWPLSEVNSWIQSRPRSHGAT